MTPLTDSKEIRLGQRMCSIDEGKSKLFIDKWRLRQPHVLIYDIFVGHSYS